MKIMQVMQVRKVIKVKQCRLSRQFSDINHTIQQDNQIKNVR